MDNNLSNIKSRCLQLAKIKGFRVEDFCKKIGLTYSNFKSEAKKTPLNSTAIANILAIIPDVNLHWLLTGEGEILQSEEKVTPVECNVVQQRDPRAIEIIELQRHRIKDLERQVANKKDTFTGFESTAKPIKHSYGIAPTAETSRHHTKQPPVKK